MPKKENTPEVPENSDAKEIQKWSVWTQGPKDAKETKRKFKQITPGQSRDYKYLVKNRKMQRYEEVILTAEDAPTMSAGTGGFSSNPEKSGVDGYDPILGGKTTKVYRRKPRLSVDGRTKGYREAVKRILDRNHKRQQQEIAQRLSQFGVSSNPFQREETNMSKKYLKTKEGSIEAAVLTSIATEVRNEHNINSDKPILTLPKNRYFKTKEGSIEEAVIEALADKKPTQFTDPDKQKMVGVKDKKGKVHTKVVKKDDPKYANHPEHESVEVDSMVSAVAEVIGDFAETKRGHKRKKHNKGADEDDGTLKKFDDVDKKDDDEDGPKGKKDKLPPWLKKGGKKDDDDDPKGKKKKGKKDKEEVEVDEGHPGQKAGSHKLKKGYKMTANGDIVRVATNPSVLSKRKDQKDVESSKVNPDKVDYNKEEIECEGKIKDKLKKFGKDLKQQWKNDLKDFDPSRKHRGPAKTHESKEVEAGERDVGSAAYADYVADTTPGEGITSKDAKKSDVAKKKELAYNKHRTTKVDEDSDEDSAYQKNVAYDTARHAAKTKYMKITDKGKRALKKGDHKLKITPTGKAAIKESDDDLAKAMKAREKFAFAKKQQKASAEHQRTMDRLGNRTSRKEKASGIGRPDANLSQKEGVEEEVKFKVKLTGLPVFYVDGKSVGEIKQSLRRKLKKPNDDIESIERVTTTAVKKDFRSRVSGSKDKDMDGQVDEIHSPKKDQSYYDDNEKFKKKNPKKVTVLKPSLKGMPKKLKDIVRARKEV